jgi:mono/diheme cytochrome c family protein
MNSRSFRASKIQPYQPSKENMKSLWILIAAGMTAGAMAADKVDTSKLPPAAKKDGVTFATDIKPIFEKSCVKCHGPEKQKGKIRVDSLEATLKGGEDGAILTKGKSAESTLVHSVARLVEDDAMPPEGKGDPLTNEQIGLIRAWIDQGAK